MRRADVKRSSRIIDVMSLTLICVGALVYLFAFVRMEAMRTRPYQEFVPFQTEPFARTREHARLTRVSHVGLGLCGVGVLVGLSAAAHAYIIARRKTNVPA